MSWEDGQAELKRGDQELEQVEGEVQQGNRRQLLLGSQVRNGSLGCLSLYSKSFLCSILLLTGLHSNQDF